MQLRIALLFALTSPLISACASSPRINDAPLGEESQKELEQTLIGTWMHTHTIQASGTREPVEKATVTWRFEGDGTGLYTQKVPSSGEQNTWKFTWKLEGRNIILDRKKADQKAFYRADTWSPRRMQWYNYMDEKSYVVRQQ